MIAKPPRRVTMLPRCTHLEQSLNVGPRRHLTCPYDVNRMARLAKHQALLDRCRIKRKFYR